MNSIPNFYLYGEPHRSVTDDFVHVEYLADRSRPSEWTIQPHAHADLHHMFFIARGGGEMRAEARTIAFNAPAILVIPATAVHGFSWISESAGHVLTLAGGHLARLLRNDPEIAILFSEARVFDLTDADQDATSRHMAALMQELGWSAIGHRAAVDAALLALIVTTLRLLGPDTSRTAAVPSRRANLVARLRDRIEHRFRLRESIADYAEALGVSESNLRAACMQTASISPTQILDARALLEARRALLYSNMTIGQIAYSIGFSDPAYFSRFFTRHSGESPKDYRRRRGAKSQKD